MVKQYYLSYFEFLRIFNFYPDEIKMFSEIETNLWASFTRYNQAVGSIEIRITR